MAKPPRKPTTQLTPSARTVQERIRAGAAASAKKRGKERGGLGGPPPPSSPVPPPAGQAGPVPPPVARPGEGATPAPPGMGVGAAFAQNREMSLGTDPLQASRAQTQEQLQQPTGMGPPPGGRKLSPETVQGIQALHDAQQEGAPAKVPPGPPDDQEQAADSEAEPRPELEFGLSEDPLGLRNLHNDPERRKTIEGRCEPMDFDDFLQHLELRQTVPIVPGKLEVTFRTPSGSEDLFVKQYIGESSGTDRYVLDRFAAMNLALGIVHINGGKLTFPDHLDENRQVDKEQFDAKLRLLLSLPLQMLADLAINYMWFDARARELLTVDTVKNG